MAKVSNETRLLVALVKERTEREKARRMAGVNPPAGTRDGMEWVINCLESIILELERR